MLIKETFDLTPCIICKAERFLHSKRDHEFCESFSISKLERDVEGINFIFFLLSLMIHFDFRVEKEITSSFHFF